MISPNIWTKKPCRQDIVANFVSLIINKKMNRITILLQTLLCSIWMSCSCSSAPKPAVPDDNDGNAPAVPEVPVEPAPEKSGLVFGYVQPAAWNFEQSFPNVQWDCLTHILPSFCFVREDGTLDSSVLDKYIKQLRDEARKHGIKVIPSFRSTGGKDYFSRAIATAELREKLADNITRYVGKYGLDGVDIDFEEYERIAANRENLFDLFKRIREKMDKSLLMTSAVNPAQWLKDRGYGKEWHTYFDYINVMSYDRKNGDTPVQTASYEQYVEDMVFCHETLDIPYHKLLGGLPFYGFSWDNITGTDNAGGITFNSIMNYYRDRIEDAKDRDNIGDTYYNGHRTIRKKCEHALETGMGGVMIWQLFQDSTRPDECLLRTVGSTMLQNNQ